MKKVETGVFTLKKLVKNKEIFSIPSYQRPYVWGEEAINALFDDIVEAYKSNPCKEYFIGTVLTSSLNTTTGDYSAELIDGQQRFTTLMLLATAFKVEGVSSKITSFIHVNDNKQRIRFDIRDQVECYIQQLVDKSSQNILLLDDIKDDLYLKHIAEAIKLLINRIREIAENDQKKLADFIYERVSFVKNVIPEGVDLNQLFAVMNNSGIQLEQTDILKSRLFKKIKHDKSCYNAIWQVCENMDNYFERNVGELFVLTDITKRDLRHFDKAKFQLKKSDVIEGQAGVQPKTIANIIENDNLGNDFRDNDNKVDRKSFGSGRAIISFPQLLLHAYRIHLKNQSGDDFETGFHTKNLLEIFEPLSKEEEIVEFLNCLWATRYYFDEKIVRWMPTIDQENKEVLTLIHFSESNNAKNCFTRQAQAVKTDTMMLQSLLYFTSDRNRQYWLSSYLYHCMQEPTDLHLRLEKIDNNLSLATNKKEASYQLMVSFEMSESKYPEGLDTYLQEEKGTAFEHYWFQKLEYILWKKLDAENTQDEEFKGYRIRSKNSVEHVFPQNEEHGNTPPKKIDSFGNLTLLSVSQNSSYGNQSVLKKMDDFKAKAKAKSTYDTLKLKCISDSFEKNKDWNDELISDHQEEMIKLVKEHYSNHIFEGLF